MGLFELDSINSNGIEVKQTTKNTFIPLRSFCFPEKQVRDNSYYVDEYGQIHRTNSTQSMSHENGYIDEYGQIIRTNNSNSSTHNSSNTSNTDTTNHSSSSPSSSPSNGMIKEKIIFTIMVSIGGLPMVLGAANGGGVYFVIACVAFFLAIRYIWRLDD